MYMQSTLIKMYMQCTFNNNVSHIVHFDFFHCTSKVGTNVHQMQFSDRSHVHFLVMYMRCTCECNFLLADKDRFVDTIQGQAQRFVITNYVGFVWQAGVKITQRV